MGSPEAAKLPRMGDSKKDIFLKICSPKAAKLPRMVDFLEKRVDFLEKR